MVALLAGLAIAHQAGSPAYEPHGKNLIVRIAGRGDFVITTDPKASPKTVDHILNLVKEGFYNRQRVHRVEEWVTQWGSPGSKSGDINSDAARDGDSGHSVPFEVSDIDFKRAVVGVASTGLQVGGDSQLFILKKDTLRLYHSYAVVGKVTRGMEVVDKIKKGDRIVSIKIQKD